MSHRTFRFELIFQRMTHHETMTKILSVRIPKQGSTDQNRLVPDQDQQNLES